MTTPELYRLNTEMQKQGIHFYYSGLVTQDMLVCIGNALRKNILLSSPQTASREAVFSVFVEQMQNLIQYSAIHESTDENNEFGFGVIAMGVDQGRCFIDCGNRIEQKDAESIRTSLNHIKTLDRKQLKEHYRNLLKQEPPEGSKGGGIGFVEIALRAEAGFEFNIADIDDHVAFFNLRVFISRAMHKES